jgi:hypothetical protein
MRTPGPGWAGAPAAGRRRVDTSRGRGVVLGPCLTSAAFGRRCRSTELLLAEPVPVHVLLASWSRGFHDGCACRTLWRRVGRGDLRTPKLPHTRRAGRARRLGGGCGHPGTRARVGHCGMPGVSGRTGLTHRSGRSGRGSRRRSPRNGGARRSTEGRVSGRAAARPGPPRWCGGRKDHRTTSVKRIRKPPRRGVPQGRERPSR